MVRNDPGAPRAIVLAGPNGAGKTTSAPMLLRDELGLDTFVNADVIAQGLAGFAPEAAAREAGRIMLRRLDALEAARESFAFETTLSGLDHLRRLRRLRDEGYEVFLFFLWLPSPKQAVSRVETRVRHGGHAIPPEVVRRRYARGLRNFVEHYRHVVSDWRMYDESGRLTEASGVTQDDDPIDRDMTRAFHAAVRLHRAYNVPLVVWADEEVRYVDPWSVSLPEDPG